MPPWPSGLDGHGQGINTPSLGNSAVFRYIHTRINERKETGFWFLSLLLKSCSRPVYSLSHRYIYQVSMYSVYCAVNMSVSLILPIIYRPAEGREYHRRIQLGTWACPPSKFTSVRKWTYRHLMLPIAICVLTLDFMFMNICYFFISIKIHTFQALEPLWLIQVWLFTTIAHLSKLFEGFWILSSRK